MVLFIRSTRNAEPVYSSYDGMSEEMVRSLMADLGHTDIELLSEEDFNNSKPAHPAP